MDLDDSGPSETRSPLTRDLLHVVLQHLREEGFTETAHRLEQESGLCLDAGHLGDLVRRGAWDDAERYLGGFADDARDEDACCAKILSAIRRQKHIEALDSRLAAEEGKILVSDLEALAPFDEDVAKMVAALENFRQRERLDTASARNAVVLEIKKLIEGSPLFQGKLEFPSFEPSRLRVLMNQSINLQHSSCKKPEQIPDVRTLFSDHFCDSSSNKARKPVGALAVHTARDAIAGRVKYASPSLPHAVVAQEPPRLQTWKVANIADSGYLQSQSMPDKATTDSKVVGLLYTSNGLALLALGSNAVHKLWKLQSSERSPDSKLWQPASEIAMKNDISNSKPEESNACIAMSKNEYYVMSASGGKVSLCNMMTFKIRYVGCSQVFSTFMMPPPAVTSIAFHPQDDNTIAFGMEDSTIQIYNLIIGQPDCQNCCFITVKKKLTGHHQKITGLAFHQAMNVLVSAGVDGQLCVWSIESWKKKKSKYIHRPANRSGALFGDTRLQFHNDQTHLLVVHESQLAFYNVKLECLCLWSPRDTLPAPISSATLSCDGLLVYAGFCDGAIGVFEAECLSLRCRIAPSAYMPPSISSAGDVYPMVIAAHPSEPNQIALGMSNSAVHLLEPLNSHPRWWDTVPPPYKGAALDLLGLSSSTLRERQKEETVRLIR
ncbi:hypothetical protein ACP70R_003385 [Stipagrostis hirtigluma subsp. patula]